MGIMRVQSVKCAGYDYNFAALNSDRRTGFFNGMSR